MKKLFVVLLLLGSLFNNSEAQVIPWSARKPLAWTDFKAKPAATRYWAHTQTHINYRYHWRLSLYIFSYSFKVTNAFDPHKSWYREGKQSPELLAHEQLHFDISELYARRLYIRLNKKTYWFNYRKQIVDIFNTTMKELNATQAKYDTETAHFLNKAKQKQWEINIAKQLKETPPY